MTASPFRRAVCLVAAAAAFTAALAPAAGAQSHAGGDCTDPYDGSTVKNGKFHYHYAFGRGGKGTIIVIQCKNGKINEQDVNDPDPPTWR